MLNDSNLFRSFQFTTPVRIAFAAYQVDLFTITSFTGLFFFTVIVLSVMYRFFFKLQFPLPGYLHGQSKAKQKKNGKM